MGASNAAAVHTHWTHLGHRDARLLLFMANVARDDAAPPVYWGGWEDAARAIGLDPQGNPRSAQESLRRSVRALADAGALVCSDRHAQTGRNAEYALCLDPARTWTPDGTRRVPRSADRPDGPQMTATAWRAAPRERVTTTVTHPGARAGTPRRRGGAFEERTGDQPQRNVGALPEDSPNETLATAPTECRGRGEMRRTEEHGEENGGAIQDQGDHLTRARELAPRRPLYARALAHLEAQPDRGAAALAGVPAHLGQRERVIAAARATGFDPKHAEEDAA